VTGRVVCADVGSTFTKVAFVDLGDGALVGSATYPTTVGTDVLDVAVRAAGGERCPLYVCSSPGGGLRLAVVGYERLVTTRAAQQVALTAGARVVHVAAGRLDRAGLAELRAHGRTWSCSSGGTDGGDAEVLVHNGRRLGTARLRVPVVVAGNADARETVVAGLRARAVPVTGTGNVVPRIGVLNPGPARAALREVFLRHVIGGKKPSRGTRLASLVRGATPDLVLTDDLGTDLAVVDVGGATTDVYSVLTPDGAPQPVAGTLWRTRTVEGDLGMRWSATGVVEAAVAERLLSADDAERDADERVAALAATLALRRHGRGRDLRDVRLLIGSGGVLRHTAPDRAARILAAPLCDHAGGWPLPRAATVVVDRDYVLAAAGLLAAEHLGGCRASAPAATHRTVDLALVLVGETRQSDTPSPAGGMCDAR